MKSLYYNITEDNFYKKSNQQNFNEIVKQAANVGVSIRKTENNELVISINEYTYNRILNRNAGCKTKRVKNENNELYKYSDIIYMLQTITDNEIYKKINMARSTYYRRKKEMLDSEYYKNLDKNKLNDINYLKQTDISNNKAF